MFFRVRLGLSMIHKSSLNMSEKVRKEEIPISTRGCMFTGSNKECNH